MNLVDPEDRDVAAGEFVLGTLADDERAAFESALADDPALQAAVYAWQDRLVDLARRAPAADPAPDTWTRIRPRLVAAATTGPVADRDPMPANESLWDRVAFWRGAAGLAMAASLVLVVLLALRPDARTPDAVLHERFLAVLQSPIDQKAGWFVEATAGVGVRLVPFGATAPAPPGKALQFWTKPAGAAGPTSLGLVRAGEVALVPVARLPAIGERQLFEVTLEPEGGSSVGRPTGPVLYVGSTVHL